MKTVKILGTGCKTCHRQYEYVLAAVKALDLPVRVEYITDMEKIMSYGVMSTPAIVVDEKIVSMGRLLKSAEVQTILKG